MGRSLREAFPGVEKELAVIDGAAGYAVSAALDGPGSLLFPTLSSQEPEISMEVSVALSLAVARSLLAAGAPPPDALAGRSMGEYPAACCAGAFSLSECFRLARRVAELGHRDCLAEPGLLVTVYGLRRHELRRAAARLSAAGELCEIVSYFDKPSLGFAAVKRAGLRHLKEALKPYRHRIRISKELGAFHSSLFDPLAADVALFFRKAEFSAPARRLYLNYDANPVNSAAALRRKLAGALNHPVKWQETLRRMLRDGVRTFVEMAPGAMLTEFLCDLPPGAAVLRTDNPENYRSTLRRLRSV